MNLPNNNFSPELLLAINAAKEAGEAILAIYKTDFKVSEKEPGQLLTRADTDADAIIHEALAPSGYPILSEESADDLSRLQAERVWIVDPLDGTADFVEKTGEFSVMIALIERHEPIVGVVYAPATGTLYVAEKGKGAFRFLEGAWEQLSISSVSAPASAKAVVSKHHFFEKDRAVLEELGVREFVQKGSAGIKISDVARGSADCYFTTTNKIKQWDTAAAYCILKEAGGAMTSTRGAELRYNTENVYHEDGILVSNGALHDVLLSVLAQH